MLINLEVQKQKDNYRFHHIAHRTPDHPAKPHHSLLKVQNKASSLIHNLIVTKENTLLEAKLDAIIYAMHMNSISFIQTTPTTPKMFFYQNQQKSRTQSAQTAI